MIGMAKGMLVTMRHLLRPPFTTGYPQVKPNLPERSRMSFTLPTDESGKPLCKSCMLCEKSCPVGAIRIESEKREDVPGRSLLRFTIDLGTCMYCGMCVENCTSSGLKHTGDFETASPWRRDMTLVLFEGSPAEPTMASEVESA